MRLHAPTRRDMLLASGTLFAWANMPKLACAEGRDPRFLAIILRGALDGLATVAPVGDPEGTPIGILQSSHLDFGSNQKSYRRNQSDFTPTMHMMLSMLQVDYPNHAPTAHQRN